MPAHAFRHALLVLGCAFLFALVAGVLMAVMPPKRPAEWVMIGTAATLVAMLGLYLGLVLTSGEAKAALPRRRVRVSRGEEPPAH